MKCDAQNGRRQREKAAPIIGGKISNPPVGIFIPAEKPAALEMTCGAKNGG